MSDREGEHDAPGWVWPHSQPLIHGDDDPLLPHLAACFPRARAVSVAVAFVLDRGVDLRASCARGRPVGDRARSTLIPRAFGSRTDARRIPGNPNRATGTLPA